jgi:MFS family permease
MHDVGASWLMTSLAPSPLMVALVQAATSLPMFFFALPAGALADVVDRRRLLLFTQAWMLVTAATLGGLTVAGVTGPWLLLAFTFLMGTGGALNGPAWQAVTLEVVPRAELPAAVALGGVGVNLARAVGPALGGLVVAAQGPGAAFLLNAVSFLGVLVVVYRWRREPRVSVLPAERVAGAIRAGLRYVRHAPALRAVLIRCGVFILGGSALWAMLPILARRELRLDALGYGVLLGCLGAGAVGGAALLPRVRQRLAIDPLTAAATLLFAAVTVTLAYVRIYLLVCAAMLAGGVAWMALMSSFNVAAQQTAPSWVRARALAMYLLVFQGGMAVGSALWGAVASRAGITTALGLAAAALVVGLAAAVRWRLEHGEGLDLTPSQHWPDPVVAGELEPDQGPVLVTVEYRVAPAEAGAFAEAMRAVRLMRLRDGALHWGLFGDTADPSRHIETFVVESWAEHLRQHERVTQTDREIEETARRFQSRDAPLLISHWIYDYDRPSR